MLFEVVYEKNAYYYELVDKKNLSRRAISLTFFKIFFNFYDYSCKNVTFKFMHFFIIKIFHTKPNILLT